jgi:uncharacterized repeat protein (TIGR01451 family)/LPXTG-motif cell wall-anchored protein
LDPNLTTITGFDVTTSVDTSTGSEHTISATLSGDNAASITNSFTVHTAPDEHVEVVANSGTLYDFQSRAVQTGFNMGNTTLNMQDLLACFQHSGFLRFTIKIVKNVSLNDNSVCVNTTPVAALTPGQNFNAQATFGNSGTTTWDNNYSLKTQSNTNLNIPSQIPLPSGTTVSPGNQVTFSLNGTAPQTPGTYSLSTQMAKNGAAFGAVCPITITVGTPTQAALTITKEVRNITTGGNFSTSATATNGNTVEYRITVAAQQATVNDVIVTDNFPSGLTYVNNTLTVNGQPHATGLSSGGLNLGSLQVGSSFVIVYRATVNSTTTIVNTATAKGSNASQVQAQATVTINAQTFDNSTCVNIAQIPSVQPGQSFSTQATFGNSGTTTWDNTYALNTISSANLGLPSQVPLPNGSVAPNSQVTFNINGVAPQAPGSYNFSVQMAKNGTAFGATCSVSLVVSPTPTGSLTIAKYVRNITKGGSFSPSATATRGDTVEYQIIVTAQTATVNNVVVTDNLPQGLGFVSGSFTVNGQSNGGSLSNGLNLGSLPAGSSVTIIYRATVNVDNGTIINTATASGTGVNSVQARATVTVTTAPPVINNALCINILAFNQINVGQSFGLPITIQNTGTSTWDNNFRLVGMSSGTSSNSYNLPNGSVAPGDQATFYVNPTVSNTAGTYYYAWQMTNGNQVFGAVCSTTLSINSPVVVNPTCSNVIQNGNNNTQGGNCNVTINTTPPTPGTAQLGVNKLVRNNTIGGSFQNSVNANNGDRVTFQVIVTNTGSVTANNVQLTDTWTGNLSIDGSTVRLDNNSSNLNNYGSSMSFSLGSMAAGQSRTLNFDATVNSPVSSTIQNIAKATADNTNSAQDDAFVYVTGNVLGGGTPNLAFSKKANNDTKNADATTVRASREDYITYTLTVTNSGAGAVSNFVISDDLSGVLPLADIVDNGGGSLSGNTITFPGINIPANGSVSKSFRVRVKFGLASNQSYIMSNTYGNTVNIVIGTPSVAGAYIAPKTGASGMSAAMFAGLITAGFGAYMKRKTLVRLVLN